MTWNYRVGRRQEQDGGYCEYSFGIVEAYYDKDVDKPTAITAEFMEPFGEDFEELLQSYLQMAIAFTKPVLDCETREEL